MHFHARSLFGASGIVKRWGLLVVSGHERAPKGRPSRGCPSGDGESHMSGYATYQELPAKGTLGELMGRSIDTRPFPAMQLSNLAGFLATFLGK
jgi:hypothetical protein